MLKTDTGNQSFKVDLKEGNDGNFGPNKLLHFMDVCLVGLADALRLEPDVVTTVYDKLFTKEVTLLNDKPDNFKEILVKYKSASVSGRRIDITRANQTMLKLNQELKKLDGTLSGIAATTIGDFIRKMVYHNSKDSIFELDVGVEDFYLSLTMYSAHDLQSVVVEIF